MCTSIASYFPCTSEGNYLAVSSLIFFPTDHSEAIKQFAKTLADTEILHSKSRLWNSGLRLEKVAIPGEWFSMEFEAGVIESANEFLMQHNRESKALLEVLEDFLVDEQPKARKTLAIAAGAIRYGQEKATFFEPLDMTLKEIAEAFDVSTSSMSKYAKDLAEYASDKNQ